MFTPLKPKIFILNGQNILQKSTIATKQQEKKVATTSPIYRYTSQTMVVKNYVLY